MQALGRQIFLRFVIERVVVGKNPQHLARIIGQRGQFLAREDEFVARRLGLLDKVASVLALARAVPPLRCLGKKPLLAAQKNDVGAGSSHLRGDLGTIFIALMDAGDKTRGAGFGHTACVDQTRGKTACLRFFHNTPSLPVRSDWAPVAVSVRAVGFVGNLHPVGMGRRRSVGRSGQRVFLVSAVDRNMRKPVPIDLAVGPGDEHARHLPLRDARTVDVEKNDAAGLFVRQCFLVRLRFRWSKRQEQPRGRQGAYSPHVGRHSPMSSFQSSGSSAIKSSINLMQSAS